MNKKSRFVGVKIAHEERKKALRAFPLSDDSECR